MLNPGHTVQNELRRGNLYRLLVEPLDIANYYRLGLHLNKAPGFSHYLGVQFPPRFLEWHYLNGNDLLEWHITYI